MNYTAFIFWRNYVLGGFMAGICMLILAYVVFALGVVNNNSILQFFFAFPALITSPISQGVCMNQPDDCGFGILFFSVVIGWPMIGMLFGFVLGLIRMKKSHV